MTAPSSLDTDRLLLRRPLHSDAAAIFSSYASDVAVTRYLGWPRHRQLEDTRNFLDFCDESWNSNGVGAYLVFDKATQDLLGSTGLELEAGQQAATGYVLRESAWGKGYASEALAAVIAVAKTMLLRDIYALCHSQHRASARVLEKTGFVFDALLPAHTEFPNLSPGRKLDVLRYSLQLP